MMKFLNFDKQGYLETGADANVPAGVTDVVFLVHGWHEDAASAKAHYQKISDPLNGLLAANPARWGAKTVAYFGVIWPSDKYNEDLSVIDIPKDASARFPADLGAAPISPLSNVSLIERAHQVATLLALDHQALSALALDAAKTDAARNKLVSTLQKATPAAGSLPDAQTTFEHNFLVGVDGAHLFSWIGTEFHSLAGTVAGAVIDNPLVHWLRRLRKDGNSVVAHILNIFAYNELKMRSGVIGKGLATSVLDGMNARGLKIHLVGHSFGARLMTAAVDQAQQPIASLTLLEGAFSHNALSLDNGSVIAAPTPGAFKAIIDKHKVTGPIAVAHSDNDRAVWIAYPLASRVFHDTTRLLETAPVFGGPTDRYGAMGANGPQNILGVLRLPFDGKSIPVTAALTSVDCTAFVKDHNDVWNEGSAAVIAAGI